MPGLDVRGKIVLLLRHEPQEFDSTSVFEGRVYTEHSQLFSKALNARAHGAIAVIYVNDTANHGSDSMEKFISLPGPADPGIPLYKFQANMWKNGSPPPDRNSRPRRKRSIAP